MKSVFKHLSSDGILHNCFDKGRHIRYKKLGTTSVALYTAIYLNEKRSESCRDVILIVEYRYDLSSRRVTLGQS
jgi:hypothetical protein